MAYTKILVIHNRLDKCVDYTQDEEKTSLEAAIDYALNREKTERTCFETAINCDRERVYQDMMDMFTLTTFPAVAVITCGNWTTRAISRTPSSKPFM